MPDALAWLESSALGTFMRDSGPWTYPVVNVIHVLGVATLFGAVLILDLRLLGVGRRAPLAAITTIAAPVAMAGFALAAASGVCLLAANALEYQGNPVLLVKFSAIGLGLANAAALRALLENGIDPQRNREQEQERQRVEATLAIPFQKCAETYISTYEATWKNDKHRQQWKNTLATYVYPSLAI